MQIIIRVFVFLVLGLHFFDANAGVSASVQPLNLTCAKKNITNYYQDLNPNSAYIKEVDLVVQEAEAYLETRLEQNKLFNPPAKLAMVLDIDDTSLSNYFADKKVDFGNTEEEIDSNYHAANDPAISPVLRLYRKARDNGVSVFFITMRKPLHNDASKIAELLEKTELNLHQAGYTGYTDIYLPNASELSLSSAEYKTKIRQQLTDEGYDIILNIGDQDSDFAGGYADHIDKIPNYLYSTSPNACQTAHHCA